LSRPVDRRYDTIILPGTKNTIGDLEWLRATGLADWILDQARDGASILGVCGGYQMMGESVADPLGVESSVTEAHGLALLPVRTTLRGAKTVRPVDAVTSSGHRFSAYEIHMGETERPPSAIPFATLPDGATDGIRAGRYTGTYLHGALESPEVLSELLGCTIPPLPPKQHNYELLAQWFDRHQRNFAELYL
jgi:adenosylcobyric acid synthase